MIVISSFENSYQSTTSWILSTSILNSHWSGTSWFIYANDWKLFLVLIVPGKTRVLLTTRRPCQSVTWNSHWFGSSSLLDTSVWNSHWSGTWCLFYTSVWNSHWSGTWCLFYTSVWNSHWSGTSCLLYTSVWNSHWSGTWCLFYTSVWNSHWFRTSLMSSDVPVTLPGRTFPRKLKHSISVCIGFVFV